LGASSQSPALSLLSNGAHVSVLHLDCLPEQDIRNIVKSLAAPRILPEAMVRQIVDRSEGVPIFATELVHALLLRDDIDSSAGLKGIPSTLSDILLARLDQLQHGRMTVQQASVLGREFDMALLVACAKDLMEDTQAAIEELLGAQLFVQRNTPNGIALSFDHMLVKDAVHQRMLRADRVRMHAKVAQVIEQQFAVSTTNAPQLLAMQYAEAGYLDRAVHFWERAGELAANQLAPKEAIAHYSSERRERSDGDGSGNNQSADQANYAPVAVENGVPSANREAAPASSTAAAAAYSMPKVGAYALPLADMAQVANGSGLEWVNSNADKIKAV
jgi:predicted ATPase